MPIVYACIAPHGGEIVPALADDKLPLFTPTRRSMRTLAHQMKEARPARSRTLNAFFGHSEDGQPEGDHCEDEERHPDVLPVPLQSVVEDGREDPRVRRQQ